jgi:hypothetical protein
LMLIRWSPNIVDDDVVNALRAPSPALSMWPLSV